MVEWQLFTAVRNGDAEVVKGRLQGRTMENGEVSGMDGRGWTPLHDAVACNDVLVTTMLLQHGADPKVQDRESGWNALHSAVYRGHLCIAQLLIRSSKEDPKLLYAKDKDRLSPFDLLPHRLMQDQTLSAALLQGIHAADACSYVGPAHFIRDLRLRPSPCLIPCSSPQLQLLTASAVHPKPRTVPFLSSSSCLHASVSATTAAAAVDGKVVIWDLDQPRQTRIKADCDVVQVEVQQGLRVCLASDGRVFMWRQGAEPVEVKGPDDVVQIALTDHAMLLLDQNGVLYSAQLRHRSVSVPREVLAFSHNPIAKVRADGSAIAVLSRKGALFLHAPGGYQRIDFRFDCDRLCWNPIKERIVDVDLSGDLVVALSNLGHMYMWKKGLTAPKQVLNKARHFVVSVACTSDRFFAISTTGDLFAGSVRHPVPKRVFPIRHAVAVVSRANTVLVTRRVAIPCPPSLSSSLLDRCITAALPLITLDTCTDAFTFALDRGIEPLWRYAARFILENLPHLLESMLLHLDPAACAVLEREYASLLPQPRTCPHSTEEVQYVSDVSDAGEVSNVIEVGTVDEAKEEEALSVTEESKEPSTPPQKPQRQPRTLPSRSTTGQPPKPSVGQWSPIKRHTINFSLMLAEEEGQRVTEAMPKGWGKTPPRPKPASLASLEAEARQPVRRLFSAVARGPD